MKPRRSARPKRPTAPSERRAVAPGKGWITIAKAPDEMTALAMRAYLDRARVPAVVQSAQPPFFGNLFGLLLGYWGKVWVPAARADDARASLKKNFAAFLISKEYN